MASWAQFVEIYTPLLYRYCQGREIANHDAADIVQEVLRSVWLAMPGFIYDREIGSFKGWLFTALRHAIGRHFAKLARHPVSVSQSHLVDLAEKEPSAEERNRWEGDYRQRLLSWAMDAVRPEFAERIWMAFEMTAVGERDPAEVAEAMGMTQNAVAIAKYRVTRRIREKANYGELHGWEKKKSAGN